MPELMLQARLGISFSRLIQTSEILGVQVPHRAIHCVPRINGRSVFTLDRVPSESSKLEDSVIGTKIDFELPLQFFCVTKRLQSLARGSRRKFITQGKIFMTLSLSQDSSSTEMSNVKRPPSGWDIGVASLSADTPSGSGRFPSSSLLSYISFPGEERRNKETGSTTTDAALKQTLDSIVDFFKKHFVSRAECAILRKDRGSIGGEPHVGVMRIVPGSGFSRFP